jgi:hypothetical protein
LFCPSCRAEFRPGFTQCADCGVELVETLGETPEAEEGGVSAGLEPFHETWSGDELSAILELFEEHAVPYVVQAGTALSLLTPSAFHGAELPEEWHARILVPGASLRTARELMKALQEAARDAARPAGRSPI